MSTNPTQANRPISISTPLGTDVLLLRNFTIHEALGRPFEMTLDLQSTNLDIDFNAILGQKVTVQVMLPSGGGQRPFHGYVSTFQQTGFTADLANYRATVVPWLWMLTRTSDCQIFQDLSVPQIVKQVFQSFGFSDFEDKLTASYPKIPFCVQYNESAFHFVSRLLEQAGISYYFDQTQGTDTMVLCDTGTKAPTFPGYGTIPYNPEKDMPHGPQHIYEWIIEQDVQPGSYAVDDYDYKHPKTDLLETATVQQSYQNGAYERFAYPGNYQTNAQGETVSLVRLQGEQVRQSIQRGVSNALGIAAGYQFNFSNYPRQDQNAAMLTTGMTLRITTADFQTQDANDVAFSCRCDFRTLLASRPFRPARITPKPRIPGPQTATVVAGNRAPVSPNSTVASAKPNQVDADEYGNVYVQFHWDRHASDEAKSSCRIRVSQNSAGSNWGSMFLPHLGNEVIVSFENGDPDCPLVTGRVYNADQSPSPDPRKSPMVSYFKDSSEQNLLSMDATANAEKVVLQNFDNSITMDSTTGSESIVITDGKSSITFDPTTGNIDQSVNNDHNTHVDGAFTTWVKGDTNTMVLGATTTTVLGTSVTNVGVNNWAATYGLNEYVILGGNLTVSMPVTVNFFKGWLYEHNTATKLFDDKVVVEEFATKTVNGTGARVEAIGEDDSLTVFGTRTETVAEAKVETYDSLTNTCMTDSSEAVTGMKSITASSFSVRAAGNLVLDSTGVMSMFGSTVMVNGDIISLG